MSSLMVTLSGVDERLLLSLLERRRPRLDTAMRTITRVGNPSVIVPVTIALVFGVVPGLEAAGVIAAWSLALSHALVQILKRCICRPRPRLPVGLTWLIEPEDRFSFPSGHAAAGLSVALPLCLALGGASGFAVLGTGLCVGVSRCYLGVHYPGDVAVGWSLATATVWGVSAWPGIGL